VAASDNSGVAPEVLLRVGDVPVDDDYKFHIGITEVTATARDMSGAVPCKHNAALNKIAACYPAGGSGYDAASGASSDELSSTCTLTVTCNDNQDPVLDCHGITHKGSCNSLDALATGSTYGTIGVGIPWPPLIQASDNSGVTIPVSTNGHLLTH
jgi:hypothetical protein